MPTYCLELYLPQASAARLDEEVRQARLAAEAIAANGILIHYVRTTYLADDETCFHLFEAASEDVVADLARRAELRYERIVEAEEYRSGRVEGQQPGTSDRLEGGFR
jgi:hypothetical protein